MFPAFVANDTDNVSTYVQHEVIRMSILKPFPDGRPSQDHPMGCAVSKKPVEGGKPHDTRTVDSDLSLAVGRVSVIRSVGNERKVPLISAPLPKAGAEQPRTGAQVWLATQAPGALVNLLQKGTEEQCSV